MSTKKQYLSCSHLLSMAKGQAKIEHDQVLEVTDSKITNILSKKEFKTKHTHENCESFQHHLIMPGFINTHTHLAMSLFRGLANDLSFNDWLFNYILPIEEKTVNPEFVNLGVELALIELIQTGTTTACDMYFHQTAAAEIFETAGIRGFLGEGSNDGRTGWIERTKDLYEGYKNHERIVPCLAPHAPYSCSDALLKKNLEFFEKYQMPIFIHVSETKQEVENSLKTHHKTPVERLHELGITKTQALFIHCVHLKDEDIKILSKTNTPISHNPESNMKIGSGRAPLSQLLQAQILVGLGTDGAASNNNLNLFGEMDMAGKLHKLYSANDLTITTERLLRMVTYDAAQAIGQGDRIGSLEVGKYADLMVLDINYPHLRPLDELLSHIVYSASGLEVQSVMCHGRWVQKNFEIQNINISATLEKVEKMKLQILQYASSGH